MLRVKKDRLHHVINFQIDDDVVIRRISGRLSHPASGRVYNAYFAPPKVPNKDDITGEPLVQRTDDKEEVIKKRLSVYHQYADELIEYYRKKNLVRTVNAQQSIDTVYNYLKTFFK
jgi:adenylate kinase